MLLTQKQIERVFENLFERLQKLRAGSAIDDSMIAGHSDAHRLANHDRAVSDDWLWRHRANCQDAAFGRVDHGGELVDAKHSQIADRETGARVFLGRQLTCPGAFS